MPEEDEQDTPTVDLLQLAQRAAYYPRLGVNITKSHATLVLAFGPVTAFTQGIDAAAMDDICRRWMHRMEEE